MANLSLIGPITQLLTMSDLPERGRIHDDQLQILLEAGIVIKDGYILDVGLYNDLISKYSDALLHRLESDMVVLPGFIDCHTHICWAGSRARDFAMRNAGFPYLEIAQSGGGIWDTVTKTRQATNDELTTNIINRSRKALSWGVTTVEVKSGYGLSIEEELRMLRLINKAAAIVDIDVVPTCLAAHIIPREYSGDGNRYLNDIVDQLLPVLKRENLTNRIDIFVERTAFDVQLGWDYLSTAKSMGFDITIHADQFSAGGSILGVRLGAVSVDHLEASSDIEINEIAKSDCVAVALPGASLGLGEPFTPARKILDQGGCLAIASDWNPGSAPMGNLLIQASILATNQKLTNAEVLAGLTVRGAKALRLNDRGAIVPGMVADFQCYTTSDFREILYQQGLLAPTSVWKQGRIVYQDETD